MYGRFGIALIKHTSTRVAVTVCWPSTWFTSCVTCLTGVGHLVVKHSTGTFSYTWWAQEKLWETAWKALIALMTKACLACWATWDTAIEYKRKCNGVEENIYEKNRTIWLCALGNCSRSGNLEIMISMKLWSCKIIWKQKHGKWFFNCWVSFFVQQYLHNHYSDKVGQNLKYIHSTTPLDQKLSFYWEGLLLTVVSQL